MTVILNKVKYLLNWDLSLSLKMTKVRHSDPAVAGEESLQSVILSETKNLMRIQLSLSLKMTARLVRRTGYGVLLRHRVLSAMTLGLRGKQTPSLFLLGDHGIEPRI